MQVAPPGYTSVQIRVCMHLIVSLSVLVLVPALVIVMASIVVMSGMLVAPKKTDRLSTFHIPLTFSMESYAGPARRLPGHAV